METHAAGGTQGGQDGREDADEGLQDELPEVFLGVIAGDHNGVHIGSIGVGHCVVNRLVDGLFYELGKRSGFFDPFLIKGIKYPVRNKSH